MSIPSVVKPRLILTEEVDPSNALKIFLCHANEDKPQVEEIYSFLAEAGFEPWLDSKNILLGQEWDSKTINEIETSDLVFICLSNNSVQKVGYVQKEIRKALEISELQPDEDIFIVPVRLDDCVIPEKLKHYQYLDYFVSNSKQTILNTLSFLRKTNIADTTCKKIKETDLFLGFIDDMDIIFEKSFLRPVVLFVVWAEEGWGQSNAYKDFLKKIYPSLTQAFLEIKIFFAFGNRQKHILSLSLLGNQLKKQFNVNSSGIYLIGNKELLSFQKLSFAADTEEFLEKFRRLFDNL